METQPPLVSILIPNYKTPILTKLCLRLIRKYTDINKAKIIVIDNHSQDESLDYLRSLTWIELIERQPIPGESPVQSHSRALDLALRSVKTPYVLSIHTDTLVKNPGWLEFLIQQIEKDSMIAGVGSWKLESKPFWRRVLKNTERILQLMFYKMAGIKQHSLEGIGKNFYYLRSHCAMYRTELLKKHQLQFGDGDLVAGKAIHKYLVERGYRMVFLSSRQLIKYLEHINHATTILNPSLSRQKCLDKPMRRIAACLNQMEAKTILNDASLDY